MPKVNEVKKGAAIELDGKILVLKDYSINNPTARGAATLYKMRFTDVKTGQKVEQTFKGDEMLNAADLERRSCRYSYHDGDNHVFMDDEDYSQYLFSSDNITDEMLFINEETDGLLALLIDGNAVALELPQSVEMTITETAPSIKGASATARTKPAEFATGLSIQVPEYIAPGERVKIHTGDRRFMGRADS